MSAIHAYTEWLAAKGLAHNDTNWKAYMTYIGVSEEARIDGVGKDAPITTNSNGASQSHLPYRFDLVPPNALFKMAETLSQGAEKYGIDNWRGIPTNDHLNHVLTHIYAYLAGDQSDEHLAHALTRMAMAIEVED